MSKACHNIVLASRRKEKPMSEDEEEIDDEEEEEKGEVDNSSGQDVSDSEGDGITVRRVVKTVMLQM